MLVMLFGGCGKLDTTAYVAVWKRVWLYQTVAWLFFEGIVKRWSL